MPPVFFSEESDMETIFLDDVVKGYLKPQQKIVLRDLIDKGMCGKDRLQDQVWPPETCLEPPLVMDKIILVHICMIKKQLRPGWVIRHVGRREGYQLIKEEGVEVRERGRGEKVGKTHMARMFGG